MLLDVKYSNAILFYFYITEGEGLDLYIGVTPCCELASVKRMVALNRERVLYYMLPNAIASIKYLHFQPTSGILVSIFRIVLFTFSSTF